MNLVSTCQMALLVTALLGATACSSDSDVDPPDGAGTTDGGCDVSVPTCPGAVALDWSATDFQPKSARFNQAYGLEAFRGKTVLVGYLSAWCPYCRAQAGLLEKLKGELAAEGATDIEILVVNSEDAAGDQANFVAVTSFPLLQDTATTLVFRKQRTQKDDVAIYDREGKLLQFFGPGTARDLQRPEVYDAMKAALKAAASR